MCSSRRDAVNGWPTQLAVALLGLGVLATGCSDSSADSATGKLSIAASFYPLQFAAEQIGGKWVEVTSPADDGVEPHDLELSPQDTAELSDAELIVYLAGFQPAIDEAITNTATAEQSLDVAPSADLDLVYTPIEEGEIEAEEQGTDPHFWLDPIRLANVGDALAASFSELAPEHAREFADNASSFRHQLESLDEEFRKGLSACGQRDLVTSHNAFGYLARAFDLNQVGITGLTPDTEPSPQQLASVAEFVEQNDVNTIYYETLASPEIAQTLADTTGANTAVLDPIEGLSESSQGSDYFEVMRANLTNLVEGQSCT